MSIREAEARADAPLDINHYSMKKSAAESMLDVALLMASASQLKAVLEQGPASPLYAPVIALISISLCLQVTVGILLIFIGERASTSPSSSTGTSVPTAPFIKVRFTDRTNIAVTMVTAPDTGSEFIWF
ncbi:ninjurin-1-like isoform X1 [Betta splendens]|uniref:Ninjurin-1-like isoform X1 n=1 Tax=Betta splendens TaxID=158456 RepID=A0A9W2XXH0_BETSP|nr:ninjurin-1-like isoform X1 [Betta splendens]